MVEYMLKTLLTAETEYDLSSSCAAVHILSLDSPLSPYFHCEFAMKSVKKGYYHTLSG